MKIYVKYGRNHVGPLTEQQVVEKVVAGEIPLSAKMFSKELGGKWMTVQGHPALSFPEGHRAGKKKKRAGVVAAVVFVLLLSGAAALYFWIQQSRYEAAEKTVEILSEQVEAVDDINQFLVDEQKALSRQQQRLAEQNAALESQRSELAKKNSMLQKQVSHAKYAVAQADAKAKKAEMSNTVLIRDENGNVIARKEFYDNGKLASYTPMKDGKPHGTVQNYTRAEILQKETSYESGHKHGAETLYQIPGGQKFIVTVWDNATIKEPSVYYNADGSLMNGFEDTWYMNEEGTGCSTNKYADYRIGNGRLNGESTGYYITGEKMWVGLYKDGSKHGKRTEFKKDGSVSAVKYYEQDKLVSEDKQ